MKAFGLSILLLLSAALVLAPSGCAIAVLTASSRIVGEDLVMVAVLTLPPILIGIFLGRWALRKFGERG
jgi:hypothetical protein